jgi:ABC-type phosphate/phosphonate transport system permease subunit
VLTTLLVMVLTVTAIDRISAFIRMRLITRVET